MVIAINAIDIKRKSVYRMQDFVPSAYTFDRFNIKANISFNIDGSTSGTIEAYVTPDEQKQLEEILISIENRLRSLIQSHTS